MNQNRLNRNKNINRSYRKLIVWQEAISFFKFVYKKVKTLNEVSFKVRAQVEDSAFSVHSNIAEGSSRRSIKENINFNNYALASLAENYSQVFAFLEAEIVDKEWFDEYDTKHYSLENKLIAYNKSQIKILKDKGDWHQDYIIREEETDYVKKD
jgi:four helix bundle protein